MFGLNPSTAFRKLQTNRGLLMALTLASVAITAFVKGALLDEEILIIVVLMALQSLLLRYGRLFARSISLEYMADAVWPVSFRLRALGAAVLAFVPLLLLVDPRLPVGVVLCLWLAFLPAIYRLYRLRRAAPAQAQKTVERLEQDRFEVVFYVAGPSNVGYQINQWLPVAERLGLRCCVVLRRRNIYLEMKPTTIPVIYARTLRDVETIMQRGPRVVLYPANFSENTAALRHPAAKHFFINHGESDKAVNQSKFLMAYDKLLVAGPLAERRLVEAGLPIRPDQVEHVGRPQVEIFVTQRIEPQPIRKILYAPTWEGFVEAVDYSSVSEFGVQAMKPILSRPDVEVRFKPHPFTGLRSKVRRKWLDELCALEAQFPNFRVVDKMDAVYDAMNWCDLMVADVGSVVNDFLASGKPIIVCSTTGLSDADFVAQYPTSAAAYLLSDPAQAGPLVARIDADDSMAQRRAAMRKDSLGDFPEGSLARFVATVTEAVNGADVQPVDIRPALARTA